MENLTDRVIELERTVATLKKDLNQLGVGLAQLLTGMIHDLTPSHATYLTPRPTLGEILANDPSHRPAEEQDPDPRLYPRS